MEQTRHDVTSATAGDDDLEDRLAALETTLDQLVGQVGALNGRLASIDRTLAVANRHLGATGARLTVLEAGAGKTDVVARLRGLWATVRASRRPPLTLPDQEIPAEGATPHTVLGRPPLVPNVARKAGDEEMPSPRVVIVTVFELADERLERVLNTVASYAARRAVAPVILTDCPRFDGCRRRNMAFEYFPPVASRTRFADDLPWDIYLGRRLALLRAKWRPIGIISFGNRGPVGGDAALSALTMQHEPH